MRPTLQVLALAGLVIGFGGAATAQQAPAPAPRGPMAGPMAGPVAPRAGGGVTAILNARRALDLTPRQVAQLDSIERGLYAERQRVQAAIRPQMDSMRARLRTQGVPRDSAARAQMRQQAETRRSALRPQMEQLRQRDSAATAAAQRLLTDAQRAKLREMQAERRGYERGMREGRGPGRGPAMRGRQGGREGMVRQQRDGRPPMMQRAPAPMRRPAPDA